MYKDQEKFEDLVISEINKKKEGAEILALFSYKNNLVERVLSSTKTKLSIVSTDNKDIANIDVAKWAEDPFTFVELATETKTKFDMILILNPEEFFTDSSDENYNLESLHKELIRDIQRNLLTDSGTLIFLTHKKGFILDSYVKPGADKLTKMVLTEDERSKSTLQAYAFYK